MTFLVWHLLAIGTVMALSFFAGYKFARRKEDKYYLSKINTI